MATRYDNLKRILQGGLTLTVVWAVLFGVAEFIRQEGNPRTLTSLNLAISGGLTLALVLLYFRQTTILEDQRDILTYQSSRQAREQHTETLRERVRAWHGKTELNPEANNPQSTNLPKVTSTSVEPGALDSSNIQEYDRGFTVVPVELTEDRYLEDFIENHAPDIKELCEEAESLYNQFSEHKQNYVDSYEGERMELDGVEVYPANNLGYWCFEQFIKNIRESGFHLQNKEHSVDPTVMSSEYVGEGYGRRMFPVHEDRIRVYYVEVDKELSRDIEEQKDAGEVLVYDELRRILSEAATDSVPTEVQKAAYALDQLEDVLSELETQLIVYEGRPIYTGECKYLEEASPHSMGSHS